MARLTFECDNSTKGPDDEDATPKPFPCGPDRFCFYCCCNPQCCYILPKRPIKHFWEAWYFWLGVALLVIIVLTTVGAYVVANCRQNLQAIGYGNGGSNDSHGQNDNRASASDGSADNDAQQPSRNEISINIIPTSAVLSTHRKIMLIAPQPSCTHLTPIVA